MDTKNEGSRVVVTHRQLGKQRYPVTVALLGLFTLGIYFIYWQYSVNTEIARYDKNVRFNGPLSVTATLAGYLLGVLIYVGSVSSYRTCARAEQMFKDSGTTIEVKPLVGSALYALGGLGFPMLQFFYPPYLQDRLNAFWRQQEALREQIDEENPAA